MDSSPINFPFLINFPDEQKRCEEIFREVCKQHRWILREIGFDQDHVHITIDAGTNGPKDIAKALKGTSGKKLLHEFPDIKKTYFWGKRVLEPDNLLRQPCAATHFNNNRANY